MKRTFLTLFSLAALFGGETPAPLRDLQVEYTKALIDFANAQSAKIALPDYIKKAEKDVEEALTKASGAAQAVLQAKSQECAAMKPPQKLDEKKLADGKLDCVQEAPKK